MLRQVIGERVQRRLLPWQRPVQAIGDVNRVSARSRCHLPKRADLGVLDLEEVDGPQIHPVARDGCDDQPTILLRFGFEERKPIRVSITKYKISSASGKILVRHGQTTLPVSN